MIKLGQAVLQFVGQKQARVGPTARSARTLGRFRLSCLDGKMGKTRRIV
jgi:hypothetical protein